MDILSSPVEPLGRSAAFATQRFGLVGQVGTSKPSPQLPCKLRKLLVCRVNARTLNTGWRVRLAAGSLRVAPCWNASAISGRFWDRISMRPLPMPPCASPRRSAARLAHARGWPTWRPGLGSRSSAQAGAEAEECLGVFAPVTVIRTRPLRARVAGRHKGPDRAAAHPREARAEECLAVFAPATVTHNS